MPRLLPGLRVNLALFDHEPEIKLCYRKRLGSVDASVGLA
jgi:hypothetical protein